MMTIDAHHHLWNPRLREYPWLTGLDAIDRPFVLDDLRAALAGHGIAGTVLVQAIGTDDETDWLIDIARTAPEILGVVAWAPLESPALADRLVELSERSPKVRGIRHQVQDEPDPRWLMRPDVLDGLRAVSAAGMTFDLLVKRPQSAAAAEAVRELPDLRFVVDHAAKPDIAAGEWDAWYTDLAALAESDNVFCKLSGLVTEASWDSWPDQGIPRYIHAVIELFGAERCMFGSDWPVSLLAADYPTVLELVRSTLSVDERESVLGGTAKKFYGLEG